MFDTQIAINTHTNQVLWQISHILQSTIFHMYKPHFDLLSSCCNSDHFTTRELERIQQVACPSADDRRYSNIPLIMWAFAFRDKLLLLSIGELAQILPCCVAAILYGKRSDGGYLNYYSYIAVLQFLKRQWDRIKYEICDKETEVTLHYFWVDIYK